ncbi:MAG TPA: hypothetical protein VGZ73_23120 [Bryobacteraceae bacterium]|jgi:hypothetical protein|nr:hypothetical protein [Bryobacteraceae bacterium]
MDEDRNAPATKGDLKALEARMLSVETGMQNLEARLQTGIQNVEARLQTSIQELEARMKERDEMQRSEAEHRYDAVMEAFRDSQTELLKAFYSYAQGNDERVASTESEASSLKKRLALVESRVTELERRLITPPAA